MSDLRFIAMEDQTVAAFRAGAPDINAQAPERHISTGGLPCRHCLADITEGDPYLILAHRPPPCASKRRPCASVPHPSVSGPGPGGQAGRSSMRESNRSCLIGHTPWNRIQYHIHV